MTETNQRHKQKPFKRLPKAKIETSISLLSLCGKETYERDQQKKPIKRQKQSKAKNETCISLRARCACDRKMAYNSGVICN